MRPTHFRFVVRSFSLLVAISPILSGALLVLFFNVVLDSKRAMAQAGQPQLTTIDFSDQSGPSLFSQADPPLTIGGVTFSGGQILTAETNNTVDTATVYGTGNDPGVGLNCNGCLATMTIDFANRASNVSINLQNGLTYTVTYTVEDDQGGQQQITLVANTDGGEATVSLPESGIRQVNISSDPDIWDFSIGSVQYSPLGVELIDPVASEFLSQYANQFGISTDTSVLATGGDQVLGASADGVTELLLRLPASAVGATYALSLVDETGQFAGVSADGGLFQLTDTPAHASGSLTVTAVDTSQGPMAFAAYVAPMDFERTSVDDNSVNRNITLQVQSSGSSSSATTNILIVRPPVVLIHGLWDKPASFDGFSQVVADPMNRFGTPFRVDYSYLVAIAGEEPNYPIPILFVGANSLGLAYNAPAVAASVRQFIASYAQTENVAAVQADVVGHSMGGLMARALALTQNFTNNTNYGKGTIDKLITVGTPHLGSELATDLLQPTNWCSSWFLAIGGDIALQNVTLYGGTVVNGAVNDLQGNGDGTGLSDELTSLQKTPLPFPIAYVGATSTSTNWANLDGNFTASSWVHFWCPIDIIANNLTPTGWTTLFSSQPSDSVVWLNSQFNGFDSGAGGPFSGIIHSVGLESLNFVGPAELDSASTIGTEVVNLLNEMKQGADFHVYAGAQ